MGLPFSGTGAAATATSLTAGIGTVNMSSSPSGEIDVVFMSMAIAHSPIGYSSIPQTMPLSTRGVAIAISASAPDLDSAMTAQAPRARGGD
jgi:hypothetical protein